MSDPYLKQIREHWDAITGMYRLFEPRNPIIEFNVQRLQVLAYPADEYLNQLSERTREQILEPLSAGYRRGCIDGICS